MADESRAKAAFLPGTGRKYRRGWLDGGTAIALLGLLLVLSWAPARSGAVAPPQTRLAFAPNEIVPIPASIPHEEGDMVDRRIVPNLRWIAQRFSIYVSDGYSGRLPGGGEHVGCRGCHVKNSDHHNGLAVDIVPLRASASCDGNWRGVTRLARWAEPRQNRPRAPFRWVGYDGDAGHGCGHHLHLSWEHAEVEEFQFAEWVEVFAVGSRGVSSTPRPPRKPAEPKPPPPPPSPPGGISSVRPGGLPVGD